MAPQTPTTRRRANTKRATGTKRTASRNGDAAGNAGEDTQVQLEAPPTTGALEMVKTDQIVVPAHRHKRRSRTRQQDTTRSIAALGIQTPLKLARTDDGRYELVAGGGRLEAARELGITEVPALVDAKDAKRDAAATAAENMVREDLSPAEEADAIKTLIDQGYHPAEIAQITGMAQKRVTARMALVEMSEEIRDAYGHDGLPPSTAPVMKAWYDGNREIAETVARIAKVDASIVAHDLAERPGNVLANLGWLMERARLRGKAPFVIALRRGDAHGRRLEWSPERGGHLKLKGKDGKWFRECYENAKYWERPKLQFTDEDLDAAVAVGVAFGESGEHGYVWIHDRDWLTAHVNDIVLPRMRTEAEQVAQTKAQATKATKKDNGDLTKISPFDLARRLRAKFTRELKPRAHSANLDLATALLNKLGSTPLTKDVAVFFAHEALGRAAGEGLYGGTTLGSGARAYAECLARVLPNLIGVDKKTLKSGKVKETIVYLDGQEAEARMWQFIEGAKSAEEVLGRTLIVFAAASRFVRECGPNGKTPQQQRPNNDRARKALERIIAKVVPASVKRIEHEKADYNENEEAKAMIAEAKRNKAGTRSAAKPAGEKTPGLAAVADPPAAESGEQQADDEPAEDAAQTEELPLAA